MPLLALFGLFHYSDDAAWLGRWRARVEGSEAFREGVAKWGRYLRRKGWIAAAEEEEQQQQQEQKQQQQNGGEIAEHQLEQVALGGEVAGQDRLGPGRQPGEGRSEQYEAMGGKPVRIVVELATAWAVTKVLLPARIAVSLWATPWFARVAVQPANVALRRMSGRP